MSEQKRVDGIIAERIDEQIAASRGKNLYYVDRDRSLKFTQGTRDLIENRELLDRKLAELGSEAVIEYTLERALREFCLANQYIDLEEADIAALRAIYRQLLHDVLSGSFATAELERRHFGRLARWLELTNPAMRAMAPPESQTVAYVVCSEYSAPLQLDILGVDLASLREPVLDIGCGEHAHLVEYLRGLGVNACGVDRLCDPGRAYLTAASWLDHTFEPGRWGTILSNLSFSSHFLNHHLRQNGKYITYARKYMEIVRSLAPGGRWHYAPSIPFIEEYLPREQYDVERVRFDGEHERTTVRDLGGSEREERR